MQDKMVEDTQTAASTVLPPKREETELTTEPKAEPNTVALTAPLTGEFKSATKLMSTPASIVIDLVAEDIASRVWTVITPTPPRLSVNVRLAATLARRELDDTQIPDSTTDPDSLEDRVQRETVADPRFLPERVREKEPVAGPLERLMLLTPFRTTLSKVNEMAATSVREDLIKGDPVTTTQADDAELGVLAPLPGLLLSEVSETQPVPWEADLATRRPNEMASTEPKLFPDTVILRDPVVGRFVRATRVVTIASREKAKERVELAGPLTVATTLHPVGR